MEAVSTTMLLTNLAKWSAGRERPAVHFHGDNWENFPENDRNLSFFSGHSSLAFSFAVSSGTVASMRGYRLAPLLWTTGLTIASFTAYSRIAADAHYFSDVATGALVGTGLGFALPYLFHRPGSEMPISLGAGPVGSGNGVLVFGSF